MPFKIDNSNKDINVLIGKKLVSQQWKSLHIKFNTGGEDSARPVMGARALSWDIDKKSEDIKGLKDIVVVSLDYDKTYTGSITVLQSEIDYWYAENPALQGFDLTDFAEFDIILTLPSNNGGYSKTTLRNCKFMKDMRSYDQTGSEPEAVLPLKIEKVVPQQTGEQPIFDNGISGTVKV